QLNVGPIAGGWPCVPDRMREARAAADSSLPHVIFHAGDVVLAVAVEIPDDHAGPADGRAPQVPGREIERVAAGTQSHPPPAGFLHAAGDVSPVVAIEVADVDIDPGDAGSPSAPPGAVEGVAERSFHPPRTGLLDAADNVVLAVAREVAD